MKNIGQIASEYYALSHKDAKRVAAGKSENVKAECLRHVKYDSDLADYAYGTLLYSVIAADRKISGKEFSVLCEHAEAVLGDWINPKKKKELADTLLTDRNFFSENAKRFATEHMTKWSDEVKEDFVFCCLAACSLDGNITNDELAWLDELMNIANGCD